MTDAAASRSPLSECSVMHANASRSLLQTMWREIRLAVARCRPRSTDEGLKLFISKSINRSG